MNRDEAYKILYDQYDGTCKHSEEIVDILIDIIIENHTDKRDYRLDEIDRWNIYNPDSLHIVYTIITGDVGFDDNFNDEWVKYESAEVVVPIAEFAGRWRELQLKSIGI